MHRGPLIKVKRFSDYNFANKFAALGLLIKNKMKLDDAYIEQATLKVSGV